MNLTAARPLLNLQHCIVCTAIQVERTLLFIRASKTKILLHQNLVLLSLLDRTAAGDDDDHIIIDESSWFIGSFVGLFVGWCHQHVALPYIS